MAPPASSQSHIGNGVSFLNKTLSAKLFSPNANAEGRSAGSGQWLQGQFCQQLALPAGAHAPS